MTYFLNLRSHAVGGWLDSGPVKVQLDPPATAEGFLQPVVSASDFHAAIEGKHLLLGVHGFNVPFAAGVESLGTWSTLLQPENHPMFLGVLWPGDSVWAHGLDYPDEPKVADEAGARLAEFVEDALADAASVSFVSHSLGARVVLSTVKGMTRRAPRVTLMAGAIDDDCLNKEFQEATGKIDEISALSSEADTVLGLAFPLGNLVAGIIDQGHPWWREALGRSGPRKPLPANFKPPFQIPTDWRYGHHHYLQTDPGAPGMIPLTAVEPFGTEPLGGQDGFHQAFSSAFVSLRLR